MQEIVRHFTASRLGRGTVHTRLNPDRTVVVELECDQSVADKREIRLIASRDCVEALEVDGVELLFLLSRHAISQVQRRIREAKSDEIGNDLDCELSPWNGDLSEQAYGGATSGYRAPTSEARALKRLRRVAAVYLRYLKRTGAVEATKLDRGSPPSDKRSRRQR